MKYSFHEKMNHNYTDRVATYFLCVAHTAQRSNYILQTEAWTALGAWDEKSQWPPLTEVMKFKKL